ncbi:hypothetical protein PUNSTDRAFT_54229, partial [Punctularia strigosozonata HHB-11173 SS5]|uniref:uncharacterized protein n=1 Tax=Punctularia strigosozonata (strain HHB-11173) TaxID=741275 RepID=UPI0004416E90
SVQGVGLHFARAVCNTSSSDQDSGPVCFAKRSVRSDRGCMIPCNLGHSLSLTPPFAFKLIAENR